MKRRAARFLVSVVAVALLGLILHLVPMVSNVPGYNGYSAGIVTAHRFLLTVRGKFGRVVLLTSEPVSSQALNRHPELAFPPTGAVPAYIFPFLTALNGTDFVVEDRARFCAAAPDPRTLILLPRAVMGAGPALELSGDRVLWRKKDYAFVFDRSMYLPFLSTNVVTIPVEELEPADFGGQHFVPDDPTTLLVHRLEFDGPVYRYVSKSKTLRLRPPASDFIGDLTFSQDPARDRPFQRIELEYVNPKRRQTIRSSPGNTTVSFDMANLKTIHVEMTEAAFNPEFNAYVFSVRVPAMRAVPPLPASISNAPFTICR